LLRIRMTSSIRIPLLAKSRQNVGFTFREARLFHGRGSSNIIGTGFHSRSRPAHSAGSRRRPWHVSAQRLLAAALAPRRGPPNSVPRCAEVVVGDRAAGAPQQRPVRLRPGSAAPRPPSLAPRAAKRPAAAALRARHPALRSRASAAPRGRMPTARFSRAPRPPKLPSADRASGAGGQRSRVLLPRVGGAAGCG
jgi:hypothetical protein